jgi:branched-chain amino acid transport system permease protein
VVMAALGGAGQLFGPLVGALILVPLEELSNSYLGGRGAGLTFVVYGAIIVIIARFLPSGLLSLFERRAAQPLAKADATNVKPVSGHAD